MKNKKILFYAIGALDVAIVGFLFVIHILMLIQVISKSPAVLDDYLKHGTGFIHYLACNLKVYGFAFVIPTFVVLSANIVCLVLYLKKGLKREKITASDLTEEEKEALKKELLKDLEK